MACIRSPLEAIVVAIYHAGFRFVEIAASQSAETPRCYGFLAKTVLAFEDQPLGIGHSKNSFVLTRCFGADLISRRIPRSPEEWSILRCGRAWTRRQAGSL